MKLVCIAIIVACVHAEPCQPGQERFGDSCYQLLTETMSWENASKTCSDMGGGLAVPDSLDEHQFIWKMFTMIVPDGNVWIGCTDISGKWVQPGKEGYECSYFNWSQGEPNGGNAENCLSMRGAVGGLWNDALCWNSFAVICEWPVVAFSPPAMFCMQAHADGRFISPCLTGHVVKEFPTKGVIACGLACRDEPRCRSFNLRQGSRREKICQLNDIIRNEADEKNIVLDNTCTYFNL